MDDSSRPEASLLPNNGTETVGLHASTRGDALAGHSTSNHAPHTPLTSTNLTHGPVTSAKRAEQNRAAQRAFRERKQRYIKELEVKATLLDARNGQLSDSEVRHRDLRTMVERLTRERDVRIKERELWWREREEVFRIVDALRKDLEQLHGENERLKEVVFGLWQESRESGTGQESMDVDGEPGNRAMQEALRKEALEGAVAADVGTPSDVGDAQGTSTSKPHRDGPSLGSIPFDTLIEKGPNGSGAPSTPSNANSLSDALLVDLKNRITYWDSERESLYRTASFPPIPVSSQDVAVSPTETIAATQAGPAPPAGTGGGNNQEPSSSAGVPLQHHQLNGQSAAQNTFMDTLFSTILQQTSGPFPGGANGGSTAGPSTAGLLPSHISALVNNPAALQAAIAASTAVKSSPHNGSSTSGDGTTGQAAFTPSDDSNFITSFAVGTVASEGKPS